MPGVAFTDVQLVDAKGEHGWKTLLIGNDAVKWGGDSLVLSYKDIILHAVCTDLESFPHPCVYCQTEGGEDDMEELRFVPKASETVHDIFRELSRCAAMHPDAEEDEEGAGEGEFSEFFDASTSEEKLQMFERAFVEPVGMPPAAAPGQFDEVDDENGEGDDEANGQ